MTGEIGAQGETGLPGPPAKLSSILSNDMDPYESKSDFTNSYKIQLTPKQFTVYLDLTDQVQEIDKLNKFQYETEHSGHVNVIT